MSHKCPDCGYGCRNFNEQHTHVCKPFTIKDIDLNHEKDVEKYIKNPFEQMSETGPEQVSGKMKFWLYADQTVDYRTELVGVFARKKPSLETRPKCGTWPVREFDGKKFIQPLFGEITWGVLKKLIFIGELRNAGSKPVEKKD